MRLLVMRAACFGPALLFALEGILKRQTLRKIYTFLTGFFCIGLICYLFFGDRLNSMFFGNANVEPYSAFYAEVKSGEVESVTINGDSLSYKKKGTDNTFTTENPESPLLKEFLLQNDVKVTVQKDGLEIVSIILDIFFYIIFFGAIIFVFRKFISPNTFKVVHKTGVKFSDVVGMDNLKKDMTQVMDIMNHPDEYAKRGIRMPKGILLEGEPGNGKTLFAKALAGEARVNFIPAKATDFESMFMAIGPMKVKLLFRKARRSAPCIVFIDEFDGIGTRRNYSGSAIETENTRIVTALLNELDGFENTKGVLVLAATNSISALDEALVRPGRFDARVSVPYPDENARKELIKMYTKDKKLTNDCSLELLAEKFKGFSCAKIESVLNRSQLLASQEKRTEVSLIDINAAIKEQSGAK
ncbi:MAG TPA: AAA family ATPase [Treponema sp.]|nr:AAA family ATPase [Treponema sp.]